MACVAQASSACEAGVYGACAALHAGAGRGERVARLLALQCSDYTRSYSEAQQGMQAWVRTRSKHTHAQAHGGVQRAGRPQPLQQAGLPMPPWHTHCLTHDSC